MDRLVFQLYRAFGFLIALLPLRVGVVIGRVLGWIGYWLAWKYRHVVLRNIEIAYPGKAPHLRRRIARGHFARLIGNLFAMEKIARMPPANVTELVEVDGLDAVMRLAEERRGFVFVIGHIGNWELLAQMGPMLFPVHSGTIYQRLGNRWMDAHVRAVRARAGLALFERKEGFNAAAELLRKGGGVGVLVDQHAGDGGVWCPLFRRLASTSPLAATLALRADAAILSVAMHTHGIGRWRMVIRGPHDIGQSDAREAAARLNVVLEEMVSREPRDWFWVHNRWKTPQPKFLLATYKRGVIAPITPSERELDEAESGELFRFAATKASAAGGGALQPFRILIRSSNWLGDAVMTVPAVRAIKHGRPDAHVTVLTPAKLADVWKLVPEVDTVVAFDVPGGSGWRRMLGAIVHVFKVARLVRGRGFEAVVLFPNSIRVAIEAWLAGIPRRVGYPGHKGRGIFLNQIFRQKRSKSDEPAAAEHQVNHYLRLAEFIGAAPSAADLEITTAQRLGTSRIAVCPGAEYGPAKRWYPKRFAEVIKVVNAWRPCSWVLVGTERDRPIADEIANEAGANANVENLCGRTTLAELIAVLRGCDALLTNDTGTMHLAALMGVRTVAIFGSTEPELTGPLGSGHIVLRKQVECSPCFLRECPIDFRCMKAIESAEAAAALRTILR